jgi:acetyl-CoA carboxylase carboxyl transferase subunit beta
VSESRRWFEQAPPELQTQKKRVPPATQLWVKCPECGKVLYKEDLHENWQVCAGCGHHLRLAATERIRLLADEGSFVRQDGQLRSADPLKFVDSKPYTTRLVRAAHKTGQPDAFISGSATLDGMPIQLGVFDFRFMGGSMGSVVGELVTRLFERAYERGEPAIVVSASGGARMQEGVLSLMQMAKTCAALARLRDKNIPYISVLTHPTTGGVAASFSMLGDLIIAEPEAFIAFAGPRVIEQTIGQALPEGFQTSEYLLEHGLLDAIVPRPEMRSTIVRALRLLTDPVQ